MKEDVEFTAVSRDAAGVTLLATLAYLAAVLMAEELQLAEVHESFEHFLQALQPGVRAIVLVGLFHSALAKIIAAGAYEKADQENLDAKLSVIFSVAAYIMFHVFKP